MSFAYCLHDYQTSEWNYKYRMYPNHTAVPETVTTYRKETFTTLTPEWQWFWYKNLIYCAFGHFSEKKLTPLQRDSLNKAWLSLIKGTRAFTNRHGPETNWEVITGESQNVGLDYIAHDALLCGGNIVEITGNLVRLGGELMYPIKTLNGRNPPPDIHIYNADTHPELIMRATIAHYEQFPDGTYRVDPFPQMAWANAHSVFLNISKDQNYVPANRVRILGSTEVIPNPYNPPITMNFANDC